VLVVVVTGASDGIGREYAIEVSSDVIKIISLF